MIMNDNEWELYWDELCGYHKRISMNIIQHKTREFVWILFNIRKCVEGK
jgi:hypothetical protein